MKPNANSSYTGKMSNSVRCQPVIARFLYAGDERALSTIRSVLKLSKNEAALAINPVLRDFSLRHRNISKIFERHFNKVSYLFERLDVDFESLDIAQKLLVGSYFTMEYSIESAAFFNPSVVEHPDQSGNRPGRKEGHI